MKIVYGNHSSWFLKRSNMNDKKFRFEIGDLEINCTYWKNDEGLEGYLVELTDNEWAGETIILGVSNKPKIEEFVKALSAIVNDIPREKIDQL